MAEKKVKIKLPIIRGETENEEVYVAGNGKSYRIKRGVYVDVPESVAEVLQHSEEMQAVAIEYEASVKNNESITNGEALKYVSPFVGWRIK